MTGNCLEIQQFWDLQLNKFFTNINQSMSIRHVVAAAGFLSRYMNGPLPYVRRYTTVLKCVECVLK